MAKHSLNELSILINQQVASMEALGVHLLEMKALLAIASEADFASHSESTRRAYFWVLDGIVEEASLLGERCLNGLFKIIPSNKLSN